MLIDCDAGFRYLSLNNAHKSLLLHFYAFGQGKQKIGSWHSVISMQLNKRWRLFKQSFVPFSSWAGNASYAAASINFLTNDVFEF